MIETVKIAENRYAPDSANAINMYTMDNGEQWTIGQLMAAVCIRIGMVAEARSINKMNHMNGNLEQLKTASGYMGEIASNNVTSGWSTIKNYMTNTLGITDTLPDNLNTFERRNQAISVMKVKLEAMTRRAQEDMIDLQSYINRRDVCFTTGTNLIKATGQSTMNIAQTL